MFRWSNILKYTCALAVFSLTALAQTSGSILGEVHDSTGAAVPEARVTVTNVDKNTVQDFVSDTSGMYNAPFLTPGRYVVSVEKSGFKKATSAEIKLNVDAHIRSDFALEVGNITESVTVSESSPLVKSESAELGQVIEEKAVRELPLNGRNFAQLVYLAPGITTGQVGENLSGASTFNPRAASDFNALGSQANSNAWLVDGIVDNEWTFNTVMVQPSVESVQEFKVLTGSFSAEYGRGAGVVSTQTKTGSNEFHGSAFEFLRNNYFDARNFFNATHKSNGDPNPQPPYRRNQYGASLGGPVIKNKTFFFMDYYGQREIKGQTFVNTVPTALEKTGNFSEMTPSIYDPFSATKSGTNILRTPLAGKIVPAGSISQVGRNVASLYPDPNNGTALVNNRIDVLSRDLKDNGGNIKIDQQLGEKDSLSVRWSFEQFELFDTKGQGGCCIPTPASAKSSFDLGPFIAGGQNTVLKASGGALNETHVFKPNLLNQVILGYARTNPLTQQSDYGHNSSTSLGIQGINVSRFTTGVPTINIQSISGNADYTSINGGPSFLPANPKQTTYQIQDSLAWTLGKHQLKFGYRIVQDRTSPFTNTNTRGALNFTRGFTNSGSAVLLADGSYGVPVGGNGLATMLYGYLVSGSRGFLITPYYLTNYENAAWFQDDFKVTSRLTLNLGVRWDLFTPETEERNRMTNFDLATLSMVYAGVNGTSSAVGKETRYKNFSPRFGFAYDMTGSGKMVVRGGFGVSYFPENPSGSNFLGQQVPWTISQNTPSIDPVPLSFTNIPTINQPFPAPVPVMPVTAADLNATNPSILGQSFKNETPYSESWNLSVQRQLGSNYLAEVAYAGSRNIHLIYGYNPQEVLPGPATVPTSQRLTIPALYNARTINEIDPRNMSNYHGLQAKMEKRLSNGMQFLASYTWAKSLDYGGTPASGGGAVGNPQTITNFKAGYGRSGFDATHRFVGNWMYETPFGVGRKYLNHGMLARVIGGWNLSGIATLQSGLPFTVYLSDGVTNGAPSWPDRIGSGTLSNPDPAKWFDPTAFVAPSTARYGNSGRGILNGPGIVNFDLSLVKEFAIWERVKANLRVDAFNSLNASHFNFPNASVNTKNPAATNTSITSTTTDNRDLQLALRITF